MKDFFVAFFSFSRVRWFAAWAVCGLSFPDFCSSQEASKETQVVHIAGSTKKICQLTGEMDRQTGQPTLSRTKSAAGLVATDLGSSFEHKGKLFFLFGDTAGRPGDRDAIAWTDSQDPEKIKLNVLCASDGKWLPLEVPGVKNAGWEIPSYGVSIDDKIYVVFTTDHSDKKTMGRSVMAVSKDDGKTFEKAYDFSSSKFINVALWKADQWLYIFGSGDYRQSSACLARVELANVEQRDALRYFRGQSAEGSPQWSENESDATALFRHDVVGEVSVAYCEPLGRYLMLYNSQRKPRGIIMRSAERPWGPWSEMQVIFSGERDGAYGQFLHISNKIRENADQLSEPNRGDDNGETYGPYLMSRYTKGDSDLCRIYFTMSTWNPYQVVVMRSDLKLVPVEDQ